MGSALSFKNSKNVLGPHFLRKLSMAVDTNQKKLYYSHYTPRKFLILKFKFQVKSSDTPSPQLQMLRQIPVATFLSFPHYDVILCIIMMSYCVSEQKTAKSYLCVKMLIASCILQILCDSIK
jgi:hypothetical protein